MTWSSKTWTHANLFVQRSEILHLCLFKTWPAKFWNATFLQFHAPKSWQFTIQDLAFQVLKLHGLFFCEHVLAWDVLMIFDCLMCVACEFSMSFHNCWRSAPHATLAGRRLFHFIVYVFSLAFLMFKLHDCGPHSSDYKRHRECVVMAFQHHEWLMSCDCMVCLCWVFWPRSRLHWSPSNPALIVCYFAMTSEPDAEPSNPSNPGQFIPNPEDWKMQLHQPTQQRSLHKCIVFRWFHLGTARRSEWLILSQDGRVRFRRITKSGRWLTWSLFPFFWIFLYVSEHVFAMSMQLPHVVAPCVVAPLHALLFSGLHGAHHMPDGWSDSTKTASTIQ